MKKSIFIALVLLAGSVSVMAQGGGNFPRRTVEERVKTIHEKLDSAFKLEPAKLVQADSVFAGYYRATDKLREEMMNGGDRSTMREKMQPIADDRDAKLKPILGDDNFKKFKDEIEPSMRRGGPGGNGGGRPQQ